MNQWTIQNRILLLALLPGILVALVLGAFFITERSRDLDQLLNSRALGMAKQLAPTCEYGVMTGNSGILQNIANHILEEQDVRAVSIYNQDMTILAHAGPKMLTNRQNTHDLQQNEQLFLLRTKDSVRVRAPVYAQNLIISDQLTDTFYIPADTNLKLLGWAEIELSQSNTRLMRYQHMASALTVIALALLICGFVVIRSSRSVTKPLRNIMATIKDLETGKLDSRAHTQTGGELGLLASGINAMANALQRANTEHQHNIEQATRDLQETLDEMEVRNRELQIGRKQALEASMMKSEFLANVSHEIRTPLNGIIGFGELLSRTQINDRQADYLATIRKSSTDLLKILNDILDLSKIDAGKLIIENTSFNLRNVLEDVLTMLAPEANNKSLELNFLIYSDVPLHIQADPLRLKQVLTNLVNNAIKFTERGSVSVRVSIIRTYNNRASIRFEVQDTGIGMNEQQLSKIFVPFSQGDASTARKYGGTGLGLIISRALIEAMSGEIRATSQPGRGSTFSFHIDAEVEQNPIEVLPPLSDRRVVLWDASLLNRMNTGGLLDQWQIQHDDCENRQQFIDLLDKHDEKYWDAFLISIGKLHPNDTHLQQIIAIAAQHTVPTILFSDSVRNEDMEAFKKLGADYVLSQPYLHQKLHRLLSLAFNHPLQMLHSSLSNAKDIVAPAPQILVVDDNPANLKLVVTLLREFNLPVFAANSGQEAIDIVRQQSVDMIFMDIQMPGMNGLEATAIIRTIPERGNIPIVALTAHAMADEKEALLKAGMTDYQTKPITPDQLIVCIERWTGYLCESIRGNKSGNATSSDFMNGIFDAAAALRHTNYNATVAIEMFRMLLEPLGCDMQTILAAWEDEDMETLLELVHKLHGASRYCGVPALQNALESFELALKEKKSGEFPDRMRQLAEEVSKLQHWSSTTDWHRMLNEEQSTR